MWITIGSEIAAKVWEEMMMDDKDNTLYEVMNQEEFARWVDQLVHTRAGKAERGTKRSSIAR